MPNRPSSHFLCRPKSKSSLIRDGTTDNKRKQVICRCRDAPNTTPAATHLTKCDETHLDRNPCSRKETKKNVFSSCSTYGGWGCVRQDVICHVIRPCKIRNDTLEHVRWQWAIEHGTWIITYRSQLFHAWAGWCFSCIAAPINNHKSE